MIAEAETAARQANLAEHRRYRDQQPVLLLAVVLALNAPAAHDHGAVFRHVARQLAQHLASTPLMSAAHSAVFGVPSLSPSR